MNIISGIYKIVNLKNGKFYIGSSKNIIRRWYFHKSALKNKRHHCIHLQRSWNKHGESSFRFEIIKKLPYATESILFAEELKHISDLLPQYNIGGVSGGDNLTNNPNRESIIKRITSTLQKQVSKMTEEERRLRWSRPGNTNPNWKGGSTYCICGNRINSNSKCCIKCVDRKTKNNSFYGHHHTDDTKKYLSSKMKGKLPPNTNPVSINGLHYKS